MKIIKFKLSGKTAFFKKPDVNAYVYFSYSQIHKVALLGIFGAILGLKGYNQMNKDDDFPEFYDKLKNLQIAIEPLNSKGFIVKKIQQFNNSVGYASKEMGGNLIVKEQWLENPAWNIYVNVNSEEASKLSEYLINRKACYIPYLGKNDHIADISEVELLEGNVTNNKVKRINSLVFSKNVVFDVEDEEEENDEAIFKYEEYLPIALTKETNQYVTEKMEYTNMNVISVNNIDIVSVNKKNIMFF